MTRKFKKLDGNATLPERATEHSAGYDISASETVTIQPDEIKLVSTGLAVQLGHDEVLMGRCENELLYDLPKLWQRNNRKIRN